MTVQDIVRQKASNKGWTYTASGLSDTYSRPVTGWTSPVKPTGVPAWDDIANWKPRELVQVIYDANGDVVSAQFFTPDATALDQGRWVATMEHATGTKAQQAAKTQTWLDKQAT